MVKPLDDSRPRFGYLIGVLPGVLVHLLGSVAAWTFVQLNGLMVAGCGADRPCNYNVTDLAVNGIQPVLLVAWALTAALAFIRPVVWRRSPYPVLGIGFGVSAVTTVLAYLLLRLGSGVL